MLVRYLLRPFVLLSCRSARHARLVADMLATRPTILTCRDGLKVVNLLVAFSIVTCYEDAVATSPFHGEQVRSKNNSGKFCPMLAPYLLCQFLPLSCRSPYFTSTTRTTCCGHVSDTLDHPDMSRWSESR